MYVFIRTHSTSKSFDINSSFGLEGQPQNRKRITNECITKQYRFLRPNAPIVARKSSRLFHSKFYIVYFFVCSCLAGSSKREVFRRTGKLPQWRKTVLQISVQVLIETKWCSTWNIGSPRIVMQNNTMRFSKLIFFWKIAIPYSVQRHGIGSSVWKNLENGYN